VTKLGEEIMKGLVVLSLLLSGSGLFAQDQSPFDILIRNGFVIDGTGNPALRLDIGIRGDTIAAMGRLRDARAARTIDASGLHVAPGFIDLHSHADRALSSDFVEARRGGSLVHQGLTTVVGGPDGRNTEWPLSAEYAAFEEAGISMNVVPMVGHNTIRREVMGEDYEREATREEVARMKELVREGMEDGAWGLFAGLEYRPGRFSTPEEVLELAEVVAEYDGFYIAHQRSEASIPLSLLPSMLDGWPVDGLQALEETIEIARRTGIRVVASHMKSRGRSSFGRSAHDVLVVKKARAEGLQVYLDVYPYETFGGGPRPMIPRWCLVDDGIDTSGGRDAPIYGEDGVFDNARENLRRRWHDPQTQKLIARDIQWIVDHNGGPDRVVVVDYPDSTFNGKTLFQLARERGESYQELVVHMALHGYDDVLGGAWTRGYGIHELDIENYIREDFTATGSDAAVSGVEGAEGFEDRPGAHPRHFGAFVRKISRYVKEREVISLPFAIRSSTGLPAQIIGLTDRGLLREGFKADIVIFDLDELRDRSTVLEPALFSEGIEYVINNGTFSVEAGELTGALEGRILERSR
jgi:N-acyl-D-amino-acid deacylase